MQAPSPLLWAIETLSTEATHAIIVDLLTFRADRDHNCYGLDTFVSDTIIGWCLAQCQKRPQTIAKLFCHARLGMARCLFCICSSSAMHTRPPFLA